MARAHYDEFKDFYENTGVQFNLITKDPTHAHMSSVKQVGINFGTPLNVIAADANYQVAKQDINTHVIVDEYSPFRMVFLHQPR